MKKYQFPYMRSVLFFAFLISLIIIFIGSGNLINVSAQVDDTETPTETSTEDVSSMVYCPVTDTPTSTETAIDMPTSTATVIPTETTAPTITETQTETATPTFSETPTETATFTPTASQTLTLSPTSNPIYAGWVDDQDNRITYTGTWIDYTDSRAYNNAISYSNVIGSTASIEFYSDRIAYFYTLAGNRGTMQVQIDGEIVASLNQYSSIVNWQSHWVSEPLELGYHTLTLTHFSGEIVDVDSIFIYGETNVGPGTYDDRDNSIRYVDTWVEYDDNNGPYNNTLTYSNTIYSKAIFVFNSNGVTLDYTKAGNRGVMEIKIDGEVVANLNQYSSTVNWQTQWISDQLTDGCHLLSLTHKSGEIVDVDSIIVHGLTPTPTATKSQPGTYDDRYSEIDYVGSWVEYDHPTEGPYNQTLTDSSVVGSTATLAFEGNQITWVYTAAGNRGTMRVSIDGITVANINQYSSVILWQQQWTSGDLGDGWHTITLTQVSAGVTDVDALIVSN